MRRHPAPRLVGRSWGRHAALHWTAARPTAPQGLRPALGLPPLRQGRFFASPNALFPKLSLGSLSLRVAAKRTAVGRVLKRKSS